MKFTVHTLGCKTNQAEGFNIQRTLCEAGYTIADIHEKPDICIINTCSVTSKSDQQSRQLINKYSNKNIRVIVTGCYSEMNYDKLKLLNPEIEVIRNKEKLDLIRNIFKEFKKISNPYIHPRHRPAVKVQDGCNNACSYCVIPMTRGRSRSIDLQEIIEEVLHYESLGYKEIVLTGIHLGAYGADLNPKISLAELLKKFLNKTKFIRFRLSSLEVKEIDDELLEVLSEKRICKHLHIPLQSADKDILSAMNRTYSVEQYRATIDKILYLFPYAALGTDVIVGFPGENNDAFHNTKSLLEEMPFSYLHIFPYSPRPYTIAMKLPQQIDDKIKKSRSMMLKAIGDAKKVSFINRNIGKVKQVIIESMSGKGFIGTSEDYIKVYLPKNEDVSEGKLVNAMIDSYKNSVAIGLPLIQHQTYSKI